jgi:repressor LexA
MLLTPQQQKVFNFIKNYYINNGISPTMEEVAKELGISIPTVQGYFKELEYKGFVKRTARRSRSLIPKGIKTEQSSISLPLLGMVGAGYGVQLYEETLPEYMDVPAQWISPLQKNTYFCLTVKGFSMIDDGILEDDTIVIKKQDYIDNNEIMVISITHEYSEDVTVKRAFINGKKVELRASNPTLSAQVFPSANIRVVGKFVGLLRDNIS